MKHGHSTVEADGGLAFIPGVAWAAASAAFLVACLSVLLSAGRTLKWKGAVPLSASMAQLASQPDEYETKA